MDGSQSSAGAQAAGASAVVLAMQTKAIYGNQRASQRAKVETIRQGSHGPRSDRAPRFAGLQEAPGSASAMAASNIPHMAPISDGVLLSGGQR